METSSSSFRRRGSSYPRMILTIDETALVFASAK